MSLPWTNATAVPSGDQVANWRNGAFSSSSFGDNGFFILEEKWTTLRILMALDVVSGRTWSIFRKWNTEPRSYTDSWAWCPLWAARTWDRSRFWSLWHCIVSEKKCTVCPVTLFHISIMESWRSYERNKIMPCCARLLLGTFCSFLNFEEKQIAFVFHDRPPFYVDISVSVLLFYDATY